MSLLGFLMAWFFPGLVSTAAYDAVRTCMSRIFQKSPVELLLDSIEETVSANQESLQRFTRDGQVRFRRDELSAAIDGDRALERPSSPVTQEEDLLNKLVELFASNQLIEIGGHQLSEESYGKLVKDILTGAKLRFRQKLIADQVAFNEVLLSVVEGNKAALVEIQAAVGILSSAFPEVLGGVEALHKDLQTFELKDEIAEVEVIAPSQPRVLTQTRRIQVIISAASSELAAERKRVRELIGDFGLRPVVLDPDTGVDASGGHYSAYIQQSEIFIGILGSSYGRLAPGMSISQSHDAYRLAAGKPRLVYVKESDERDPDLVTLLAEIRDQGAFRCRLFADAEGLAKSVKDDITELLSERFTAPLVGTAAVAPVDYLAQLKREIATKGLVERAHVGQEIRRYAAKYKTMALIGEPGIGKTFLLGYLGELGQAVYVSLKGQTSLQVFAYLANQIRMTRDCLPVLLQTENEARWQLEDELRISPITLLIDDVDHNPEIAQGLLSVERFQAEMILALRSPQSLGGYAVQTYEVPPFSTEEIRAFLSKVEVEVGPGRLQELRRASKGNPLYLYYFSIEQVEPLPESITAYQEAIWRGLGAREREILALLSTSLFPKTAEELRGALEMVEPSVSGLMETVRILEELRPIVRRIDKYFEPFHPFFAEFVEVQIEEHGLAEHYHRILGEIALQAKQDVEIAYHLSRAGDERAKQYFGRAAHMALMWGYPQLAEEFFIENLTIAEHSGDVAELAGAHFGLAELCARTTRVSEAKKHAESAVSFLKQTDQDALVKHIETWSSTVFLDELDPDLAIRQAQQAVDFLSGRDPDLEAATLVCLSYLFVRTSRFKQGVEAARQAYEIFKDRGNREGMIVSMTNMSACLGGLDDRKQQRRYAHVVISAADELNRPRLRAAGLNHLAICQRKDGQAEQAKVSLEDCIAIAQELRDADCEVMNINNLGNVYFDLRDLDEAERCHKEALRKATEHGIRREEARSLELLARIESRKQNHSEVLRLSEAAIDLYNSIGDEFRIASTLEYSGWAYAETGRYVEAAESYQRAAEIYHEFGTLDDAAEHFERAGTCWVQADNDAEAVACFHAGIQCALAGDAPEPLASLLEVAADVDPSAGYGKQYLELLRMYIRDSRDRCVAGFMPSFAAYFKRRALASESRGLFARGLEELLSSLAQDPNPNTLNAVAVALEQTDERLIDETALEHVVTRLAETVDGLYKRQLPDGHEVYTIGLRWETNCIAQVYCWETDLTTRRVALVLALVLAANREFLESQAISAGGIEEQGFVLNLLTQSDFEASIMAIPDGQKLTHELPFTISESNVPWDEPQPQSIGIVHDDYAEATDWASRPNNKTLVWLLMVFYAAFVGHVAHRKRGELARQAREFAELILG